MRDSSRDDAPGTGATPPYAEGGRATSPGAGEVRRDPVGLRVRIGYRAARLRARLLAWRRRMNATPAGRIGVKVAVAVLGTLVIAVGVVLLPLPGPGWLIVFAGLAILALEFHWARRLLSFGRRQLRRWTATVREGSWIVRVTTSAGLFVVVLVALWLSARLAFGIEIP